MRKLLVAVLLTALLWGCGGDSSTNNNGGIFISVLPERGLVDFGDTIQFFATVTGTTDNSVIWRSHNVTGGDSIYGTISISGIYIAPLSAPIGMDSVKITALLAADTSKTAIAYAILIDPAKIYVSIFGNDTTGLGSEGLPYRTISKALDRAISGQTIYVGAGDYNIAAGEEFPLLIPGGVAVFGSGPDSSFITGPGGVIGDPTPWTRAAFETNGDAISIEGMTIRSANSLGTGVWLKPGRYTNLTHNSITNQNIGVYISGTINASILDGNHLTNDSIGVVTADSSRPTLRNNYISGCAKYGIDIRNWSRPDLGTNDSTFAGNDTIQNCGDNQNHWLIYNGTPNIIQAQGNYWQDPVIDNNDIYIYDNEESGGASGEVILSSSRKR
jgi:parallel beta-helix repeat protein